MDRERPVARNRPARALELRLPFPHRAGLLDEQIAGKSRQVQAGELLAHRLLLPSRPERRGGAVPEEDGAVLASDDEGEAGGMQDVPGEPGDAAVLGLLRRGPIERFLLDEAGEALLR